MKADKYHTLKKARYRKQQNETNDCSVIAVAIVCRLTYKAAHETLSNLGRINRRGVQNHMILAAARMHGFTLTEVTKLTQKPHNSQKVGSMYTPITIGDKLKRGYYFAFVYGHVLSVVNGDVYDWTEGRKHRINEAYKVTRTKT